jgi:hypothetical protein
MVGLSRRGNEADGPGRYLGLAPDSTATVASSAVCLDLIPSVVLSIAKSLP